MVHVEIRIGRANHRFTDKGTGEEGQNIVIERKGIQSYILNLEQIKRLDDENEVVKVEGRKNIQQKEKLMNEF